LSRGQPPQNFIYLAVQAARGDNFLSSANAAQRNMVRFAHDPASQDRLERTPQREPVYGMGKGVRIRQRRWQQPRDLRLKMGSKRILEYSLTLIGHDRHGGALSVDQRD
jgi:hypothetical protein